MRTFPKDRFGRYRDQPAPAFVPTILLEATPGEAREFAAMLRRRSRVAEAEGNLAMADRLVWRAASIEEGLQ